MREEWADWRKHVEQVAGKTRVFCFGIGNDVNTHLLDKITAVAARAEALEQQLADPAVAANRASIITS